MEEITNLTVEEAVKEALKENNLPIDDDFAEGFISGAIVGANWQKEQSLTPFFEWLVNNYEPDDFEHWVKKFFDDRDSFDKEVADIIIKMYLKKTHKNDWTMVKNNRW